MAAAPPKFDIKMLVMPAMLFISRKIDMKNEANIKLAQMVLVGGIISCYSYSKF
jgi:hypothetical protein